MPPLHSKNKVPHVPFGTKILAYTDVTTQKGKRIRLVASEPFQDRIFYMQVIGCMECPLNTEEEISLDEFPINGKVFGYLRINCINVDRLQSGAPTLGDYADHIGGVWMRDDKELDKHFEGRPYYGGRDANGEFPGARRAIREVWEELWTLGLRRNIAWVEMMSVDKEHQRKGVAQVVYGAMAGILEKENLILARSSLLSNEAKAFWQANESMVEEFKSADGKERHKVKPVECDWKFISDIKRESGEVLKYDKSLLRAPELVSGVRLSAKCKDLLDGMYITQEEAVYKRPSRRRAKTKVIGVTKRKI